MSRSPKPKTTRSRSSSADPTTRYAKQVTSGKQVAGPLVRAAKQCVGGVAIWRARIRARKPPLEVWRYGQFKSASRMLSEEKNTIATESGSSADL
jgi:hypothetical protein